MFAWLLLLGSVGCEVIAQLCFKRGSNDQQAFSSKREAGGFPALLRSPWIIAGVGSYAVEFALWGMVISMLPLTVAIPFSALAYALVVAVSRMVLGEYVSGRRWAGAAIVSLGVGIACWPVS